MTTNTTMERCNVPLLDLKAQYAEIADKVTAAIQDTCRNQRFILGPEVDRLEKRIAAYSQCKFGIGVSSGTDALLVALMALDIGPGDEVITTPYTFFATAGAVARLGARPVFCDIDPQTFNLSGETLAECIAKQCEVRNGALVNKATGGRIKAIIPVHLFGQMVPMAPVMEVARKHGLRVIEDAAQAIGAEQADGTRAGSVGDIGCFSFFPSKNLGAFGDGGMCTTNDEKLAERLRVLRAHGSKPKYYHAEVGGNFRLDEIQAAVLNVKLDFLDGWTQGRNTNAAMYDRLFGQLRLQDSVRTPLHLDGFRHVYNQYVIRVKDRDALRRHLTAHDVGTEIYYPVPLHAQKCFAELGYANGDFPVSMAAAADSLALPIYPELSARQLEHVARAIAEFYGA
jgi:dTDP-4-amino-4,6-dideoxygalactose transaminase